MLLDDFLSEYYRRDEPLGRLWRWLEEHACGHLHFSGPAGSGKSWLLRGLAGELQEQDVLVLFVEKHAQESLRDLIWKAVDTAEYVLDSDEEMVRMEVSKALYRSGPTEAVQALLNALAQDSESGVVLILDGLDADIDLDLLPLEHEEYARGVYLITSGQARQETAFFVLHADSSQAHQDLLEYARQRLPDAPLEMSARIALYSQGNWNYAFHYCQSVLSGLFTAPEQLPEKDALFEEIFDRLARRAGKEKFRTIYLDVLILLAVSRVPITAELLSSWGVAKEPLGFALFELRHLLRVDGESSRLETLFTGEQYSLASPELGKYLRTEPAWRDRVAEAHARAVGRVLKLRDAAWTHSSGRDEEFYALCFAEYHLREAGRTADLQQVLTGETYPELCWTFSRLAREQGYEEISLALILLATERLEPLARAAGGNAVLRMAELQIECCGVHTQHGLYADAARFAEHALESLRAAAPGDDVAQRQLLAAALVAAAEPFLFMGMVEEAHRLFQESLDLNTDRAIADPIRTVHALRGLARASRAMGRVDESLQQATEAIALTRQLIVEEGEEWAHFQFDLMHEQIDFLKALDEDDTRPRTPFESLPLRLEILRYCREADALYERFKWTPDADLAGLLLEESMLLFEMEKWSDAEQRLSRSIVIYRSLEDVHPGEIASLEYLRSQALALMNRIGEAAGSLSQRTTAELVEHLDASERALVLFFRAKVLSHEGHLKESDAVLGEAIELYRSAIEAGQDELRIEMASALTYQARVAARRGRLSRGLKLCQRASQMLNALLDEPELNPSLELADVHELLAWIYLQQQHPRKALEHSDLSLKWLDRVVLTESDPDLETERSVSLITRGQVLSSRGNLEEALAACDRAIEIERRRAQEGYDSGPMWVALHLSVRGRVLREHARSQEALAELEDSLQRLRKLASAQQSHLGPQRAGIYMDQARCQLDLKAAEPAREALESALAIYEAEMANEKEYLIAPLIDAYRLWLECLRRDPPPGRSFAEGCTRLARAAGSWGSILAAEGPSDFLKRALEELREWADRLTPEEKKAWRGPARELLGASAS